MVGKRGCGEWILEGEMKGCFEDMSDEWVLENIGMDKVMVKKWVKWGLVLKKELLGREEGSGEGGIMWGSVGNMRLEGVEGMVGEKYYRKWVKGEVYYGKVEMVG